MSPSKAEPGYFILLYFASAASYTAKDSEMIKAPLPLSSLFDYLENNYKGIKSAILDSCLVTVNLEYVDMPDGSDAEGLIIKEGDEIAIIPPVSSG